MGLTKRIKSYAFSICQVSENTSGKIYEGRDLTNIINREDYIKLYRGTYYINSTNTQGYLTIQGDSNQSVLSDSGDTKLVINNVVVRGILKLINLYVVVKKLKLDEGAKLQLINCYVKSEADEVNGYSIDAKLGTLEIENSKIHIVETSNFKAPVIFGYNVKVLNSSIDSYKFGSTSGNLILQNSSLNKCIYDVSVIPNYYYIKSNHSSFNLGTYGLFDVEIEFSNLNMEDLPFSDDYLNGLVGYISNSKINRLMFFNLDNNSLISVKNSEITSYNSTSITFYRSNNQASFENCLIKTFSQYPLVSFVESYCKINLINCFTFGNLIRFGVYGGFPHIRTYNCVCNGISDEGTYEDMLEEFNLTYGISIESYF